MNSTKRTCLICTQDIQKNSLITHIAEHLCYKRHKCSECSFQSVLMENMVDHQNNTNHRVQFDVKNWYLERVCQLIYNDFEYAQKMGEESIRGFGSVFGDKKRLTEMLKASDVKEEDDDDIEVLSPPCEALNSSNPFNKQSQIVRRSLPEISEQSNTNSKSPSQGHPTTNQCISVDSVQRQPNPQTIRRHSNDATRSHNKQQGPEINRSDDVLLGVQTVAADSSNEHKKCQTTEQILIELQRQITKGVEHKTCKICHQMVDNDYKSQKKHVIGRHMIGVDENKREEKLRRKLEQCFKKEGHLLITNDLQCNICGHETKYKDTRYHHVSALHTDYQWNCVFASCDFVVRSKKHFNGHLNSFHKMNLNQLEGGEKDSYIMLNSDFEHKLTPLVRKCFPFDLTNLNPGEEEERKKAKMKSGGKGKEDVLLDSVVSSFMPTVDYQTLNRSNSKPSRSKKNNKLKDEYESSSYSDNTDSEHKSKQTTQKDGEPSGKKLDSVGRNSSDVRHQSAKKQSIDKDKTQPQTPRSTGPRFGSINGSFYSRSKNERSIGRRTHEHKNNYRSGYGSRSRTNEGYYESPLKGSRNEAKKQKIEEKPDNVMYFRR
ncbi:hypothetical protein niasHS_000521 [Heterodera schachtii]|uniref:C2H2-type domain-containing protein n=1 Tax=Heterodera schachtii TaxID=97005 RepID=A0ABD2K4G8_HETSC